MPPSARTRLEADRAARRAAERRKRTLVISAAVIVVLALAATIGIVVGRHKSAADDADWASVAGNDLRLPSAQMGTGIRYGRNAVAPILVVYEDFRCPICREVESALGPTIQRLADEGTIRVEYRIASFLDGKLGGNGSKYAANAAGCAQDAGAFKAYHDVLYAHQPDERSDDFGNRTRLLELASQVDGLRTEAFDRCVRDLAFAPWVQASQAEFAKAQVGGRRVTGTPTLALDGRPVEVLTDRGPIAPETFAAQLKALATPTP